MESLDERVNQALGKPFVAIVQVSWGSSGEVELAEDYVWGCKQCDLQFEQEHDVISHVQSKHGEGKYEMRPRVPPDLWIGTIPTPSEIVGDVLKSLNRVTYERMQNDPAYEELVRRRLAESRKQTKEQEHRPEMDRVGAGACQDERPENGERLYKTDKAALGKLVTDFTRKWFGISGNERVPFVGVGVEWDLLGKLVVSGEVSDYLASRALGGLSLISIIPTVVNVEWLKIDVRAMDWKDRPDCKRIVDEFFFALMHDLDQWLSEPASRAMSVAAPTIQPQMTSSVGQSETSQGVIDQTEIMPREKSNEKKIFGLRIKYLIPGFVLSFLITVFSWFWFPVWAHSPLALIVLFSVSFAGATAVVANIRKAYE